MSRHILKQIIVITDGHSNKGGCPIEAARRARRQGAVVNAIGVLEAGSLGRTGRAEIEAIAAAGGGISCFVPVEELGYTIQTVTVQVARRSLEQSLRQEVHRLTGKGLADYPPAARKELLPWLARLEQDAPMELVIAIDTSGSMLKKRATLEQGLSDLAFSLSSRHGKSGLGIIQYPGSAGTFSVLKQVTSPLVGASGLMNSITYGGMTPTGPAIDAALGLLFPLCPGERGKWEMVR